MINYHPIKYLEEPFGREVVENTETNLTVPK